jgi:molecular chaperone DnaK
LYQCEKTISDSGDKLSESEKRNIEEATSNLKSAVESDDINRIKDGIEKLTQAFHEASGSLYQNQQAPQSNPSDSSSGGSEEEEDVVDAEFEEVNN